MIPVEQTRFGGPEHPFEERGNCFGACLASLLEVGLEELPAVAAFDEGWHELLGWLRGRGWYLVAIHGHDWSEEHWPGYVIAGCQSQAYAHLMGQDEGGGHVVVVQDGEVVWNPNPRDTRTLGEVREALDGWVYFLYPLDPAGSGR
jgi:hypothetical protein